LLQEGKNMYSVLLINEVLLNRKKLYYQNVDRLRLCIRLQSHHKYRVLINKWSGDLHTGTNEH